MLDKMSGQIASVFVFGAIGLVLFAVAFVVVIAVIKHVPMSVRKEIEEDHNVALAIIIGSMILGISLIVAAAIHG